MELNPKKLLSYLATQNDLEIPSDYKHTPNMDEK